MTKSKRIEILEERIEEISRNSSELAHGVKVLDEKINHLSEWMERVQGDIRAIVLNIAKESINDNE